METEYVCVKERRESVSVCESVKERERMSVWEIERERVCVRKRKSVCERERGESV
jgi:hypothetical protein